MLQNTRNVQLFIKRIFDITASLLGLVVLSPFFIIIAVFITLETKGPVFFLQERIGKKQKRFMVFKFRTMINNAINIGPGIYTGKGDPRITKVGAFLRKTSIDELPQLINVLLGDMSIIGPRPAIDLHLCQYSEIHYKRFDFRPGISGLAQVNGRSRIPVKKRLVYDLRYVNQFSLCLDLQIILKSIYVVFSGQDIYNKTIS